jgi:predicted phosphodiesterase
MRIAVISDSHGDLVALRAVLTDVASREPDAIVVAGDIAQGGPQPVEVVDTLFGLGYPIVRGNSDEFLVRLANEEPVSPEIPERTVERGRWTVGRLGKERVGQLAGLPMQIQAATGPNGPVVVVHATPWSTEDVVLADSPEETAARMVREAGAGVLAYGHIHSPYQRRVRESVLLSVGAISGSNDTDPRPAYTLLEIGTEIVATVVRIEVSTEERLRAYEVAGIQLSAEERTKLGMPGEWPVRSPAGSSRLWP